MNIRKMARRFKLKIKRSSQSTKIAVCGTIVISVISLLALHASTLDAQEQVEAWRTKAQQLEQEKQRLEDKITNLGTLEGIKDIAQDELGLTDPDSIIIEPEN
jgi:cell division protein FtsL